MNLAEKIALRKDAREEFVHEIVDEVNDTYGRCRASKPR